MKKKDHQSNSLLLMFVCLSSASAALTARIFCSTFAFILSRFLYRSLVKNENGDLEFSGVFALFTDNVGRCCVVLVDKRARAAAASTNPPVKPRS